MFTGQKCLLMNFVFTNYGILGTITFFFLTQTLSIKYVCKRDPSHQHNKHQLPHMFQGYSTVDVQSATFSEEREREMFYLMTHSTHFIYGYMASDIWLRTILIVRKETRCRHIGYSYRLAARVLLYAPSHRQDSTYHGLCYTSRGALAGTRNIF